MIDNKKYPKRKTLRLQGYDYSFHGDYFVTIVTQGRACRFGKIAAGEMILNEVGRMIDKCYGELGEKYDDVYCLDYVIMPNHLHFIIRLLSDTHHLPDLVRQFKSKTTVEYIKGVQQKGWPLFECRLWQRSYHDHIIRNEHAFNYIRNYIFQNPERWYYDKMNPICSSTPDEILLDIKELNSKNKR